MNLRDMLAAWANWGRPQNIGYPSMSPMFGERCLKTPLYSPAECSADVAEVERAVCCIAPIERKIIIHRYQWGMSIRQLGRHYHVSKSTAQRMVENAEGAVYHALANGTQSGIFVQVCEIATQPNPHFAR